MLLPLLPALTLAALQADAPSEASEAPAPPAPITLEEALALEARIQDVHELAMRTTVGLYGRARDGSPRGEGASGVVVSADGYVLTAAHVLESVGDAPLVLLPDGRLVDGVSLGRDSRTDFGLLKLAGEETWEHAEIGESAALTRYEVCLMYGHPDGIEDGRPPVLRLGTYLGTRSDGFLRTSCKMMPGDSGGPVFDLDGQVVGINSQINRSLDRNYHVSVDPVREHWQRLVDDERWRRPREGRRGRPREQAAEYVAGPDSLAEGIPALRELIAEHAVDLAGSLVTLRDAAGSETCGVVVATDGEILTKSSRLEGESVQCVLSDGREIEAVVVARDLATDLALVALVGDASLPALALEAAPAPAPGALLATVGHDGVVLHAGALGAPLRDVPMRAWGILGVRFDRDESDGEVHIEQAFPDSPAYRAGLRVGDVVLELDGEAYTDSAELRSTLRRTAPGQRIAMKVLDGAGEEQQLEFALGSSVDMATMSGSRSRGRRHVAYDTEVSRRRGGFPSALRHDMPLALDECGTPVLDLNGRVVALNLSRHDRTGSLALPIEVVSAAWQRMRGAAGR